jgi:hypothetical protein
MLGYTVPVPAVSTAVQVPSSFTELQNPPPSVACTVPTT